MNIKELIESSNNIHFIGICGISMQKLAFFMQSLSKNVSGSDLQKIKNVEKNIKYFQNDHNINYIKNADLVVVNSAIKSSNAEIVYARENNIPIITRMELLCYVCSFFRCVVAVAGTHGKTTTATMLYQILCSSNKKVSAHIGGNIMNDRLDKDDDILIIEACEYAENFLMLKPDISIITNIDNDHLDYYKTFENLKLAFAQFVQNSGKVYLFDTKNTKFLTKENNVVELDFVNKSVKNVSFDQNITKFWYVDNESNTECYISLNAVGMYNIENSLLAINVARHFGISCKNISNSLLKFSNAERRMQDLAVLKSCRVLTDYAHHPTEIKRYIASLSEKKVSNNLIIFQPHTFSRTAILFDDFVDVLEKCDILIIYKEYPARETFKDGKSAFQLFKNINNQNLYYCKNQKELYDILDNFLDIATTISFVGAGNINKVGEKWVRKYKKSVDIIP